MARIGAGEQRGVPGEAPQTPEMAAGSNAVIVRPVRTAVEGPFRI